jgi:hypothetical protein
MPSYRLVFLDTSGTPVRRLEVQAPDEEAVVVRASEQSLASGMAVEVWDSRFVICVTPLTAQLFIDP